MDIENPFEQLSLADLRARTSVKWRAHPPDVLPSFIAEMDVPLAEPVVRAVTDAVRRGDTGYPLGTSYVEAFGAFASARWGWDDIAPARSALVADVMTGLSEAVRLVTGPGAPVVVSTPVYPPFFGFMERIGRRVVEARLGDDGRLDLDVLAEAFAQAAATGSPAAYLLCNPHNPTGVAHTRAELAAVAALAREHEIRVISDEIHAPIVLTGSRFTPYLTVAGAEDALAVFSASKAWNLAGMKAAVLLAGPEAAADLARLPEVVSHGASHLGVVAHTAALREGGAWLDAVLRGLSENREHLAGELAARLPGARMGRPEATYLAWVDCRALTGDDGALGDDPAEAFLARSRVALGSGIPFGAGGEGHVRITTATSKTLLTETVERMAKALA